ncbi:UDP-2,3-diacylglucosamine diphosphatase LpxI [Planktotalea sp.]|uniref:LpxI family protein n=1 Tax=Planktotalea sp. TaxID=2029877 RepID=UPI0025F4BADA|nr:UDP-2,3-diacylglucosamine diphosphatase LpxI [Planktotalea sp.]
MGRLAILSGSGALPQRLAYAQPDAILVSFSGVGHDLTGTTQEHAFEKMGALFASLKAQNVSEIVMAGAMSRPPLDPSAFDAVMTGLAPRLIPAMQRGDDALLRLVIAIFEEQGFCVRGAHEVDSTLTVDAGLLCGAALSEITGNDVAKGIAILETLSPVDVGQGVVVETGLCLGIETLQGTDALLNFVAATPLHLRKMGGVFVKAPKRGQDLRVDMPTIGPDTLTAMKAAKLSTLVIASGAVLLLERDETMRFAKAANITIFAQDI